MGSLTTRKSYGLKGYVPLSHVSGDEWGLEAAASSLPAKVEVRYCPLGDMLKVWIYSLHGEYLGQGVSYHRDQGVDAHTPSSPAKIFFIDQDL